ILGALLRGKLVYPVVAAAVADPDKFAIYAEILTKMIKELVLATVIAVILIAFLIVLVCRMFKAVVNTHEKATDRLNEQNKKYQDYFLNSRTSSGVPHLGEDDQ